MDAADKGEIDSIIGQEFTAHDNIRMVPDILQNDDNYFFPVFTTDEEMGEYGEHFSKIQSHFLEAMNLARNNEKNVCGIVINAFSESFVIPIELFDIINNTREAAESRKNSGGKSAERSRRRGGNNSVACLDTNWRK